MFLRTKVLAAATQTLLNRERRCSRDGSTPKAGCAMPKREPASCCTHPFGPKRFTGVTACLTVPCFVSQKQNPLCCLNKPCAARPQPRASKKKRSLVLSTIVAAEAAKSIFSAVNQNKTRLASHTCEAAKLVQKALPAVQLIIPLDRESVEKPK